MKAQVQVLYLSGNKTVTKPFVQFRIDIAKLDTKTKD